MDSPSPRRRVILLLVVLAPLVVAVAFWFFRGQRPAAPEVTKPLHTGVGEALAEQVFKAIGTNGHLVLITLEEGESPELDTQVDAFKDLIYDTAIKIRRTDSISTEKSSSYGAGQGMSGKRLLRLAQKYPDVQAFVSFVGVPDPDDDELKELSSGAPPLFAFARSHEDMEELFKRRLLHTAIVPRFQFPAPGPEKPKTNREWFDKYYQVLGQTGLAQSR